MSNKPIAIAIALLAAITSPGAAQGPSERTCGPGKECTPGSEVISVANKQDPYYACPTEELSNYVHMIIGLMQAEAIISGRMPPTSPSTGEPQYEDEAKTVITLYRNAAGVKTFNEGVQRCREGREKQRLRVVQAPSHELSMSYLVADENTKTRFWTVGSHLDRAK